MRFASSCCGLALFLVTASGAFVTACGGRAIAPGDPPGSKNPEPAPTLTPAPSAAPQPANPVNPPYTGAPDPGVTQGADVITLHHDILGGVASSKDDCNVEAHDYELTLGDSQLLARACLRDAQGAYHMQQTALYTLWSEERARIDNELVKLKRGSMPTVCGYDGIAYSLDVMIYEGEMSTFYDSDENCVHNANLPYLNTSLAPLDGVITDILTKRAGH
jgi:hypothetical protein